MIFLVNFYDKYHVFLSIFFNTFVPNSIFITTLKNHYMPTKIAQGPQKTYSQEEAYNASLKYFKGDELAARVWVNKYGGNWQSFSDCIPVQLLRNRQ